MQLSTVCSWLGHSPAVSLKHYTQTPDEIFLEELPSTGRNAGQNTVTQENSNMNNKTQQDSLEPENIGTPVAISGNKKRRKNQILPAQYPFREGVLS